MRSKLYLITVPGLVVRFDWRVVHDRLLDEFPAVLDVLATTIKETILIVYDGPDQADAWLETVSETILHRGGRAARGATSDGAVVMRLRPADERVPPAGARSGS